MVPFLSRKVVLAAMLGAVPDFTPSRVNTSPSVAPEAAVMEACGKPRVAIMVLACGEFMKFILQLEVSIALLL